ncbi:MAG: hypothetical protein HY907_10005 [Deltaproteobacteria bacterium]|nr:hypothetical protein [Deltaproteobacteria bacterium]
MTNTMARAAGGWVALFGAVCGACGPSTAASVPPPATSTNRGPAAEPCEAFPTPVAVRDAQTAIRCSYASLLARGLEDGFTYDGAEHLAVRFPSGDEGAVVAIGFSGIVRGYLFLYRIHGDAAELVALDTEGQDWGIRSLQDLDAEAPLEIVDLFPADRRHVVVKVTGAVHPGTGLWADGYFELREVTDGGLPLLFSGAETSGNYNFDGFALHRTFAFEDLDGDGTREIVEQGTDCDAVQDEAGDWREVDCAPVRTEHRWNGARFEPPGPGNVLLAP